MQRIFTHISKTNLWQSVESASGRGSELACTEAIRTVLPGLLQELNITSILDAPCGDFNWMRFVPLSGIHYTGVDVVADIIEHNQQKYGTDTCQFMTADITRASLPNVDLIICRDCLVHLPFSEGSRALQQFQRSGSTYLLATTYPKTTVNSDKPAGSWRSLNLRLPPFNFPEPLKLFSDPSDDTGANPDKSIGLWRLADITPPAIAWWNSPDVALITFVRQYVNPAWRL